MNYYSWKKQHCYNTISLSLIGKDTASGYVGHTPN